MEIKIGDYVRYKGKVYSVANSYISERNSFDLISYKDLEILEEVPKSELERLTDFHIKIMRYNKDLPPRRFRKGDNVKIRAELESECVYSCTFRDMGFVIGERYDVDDVFHSCRLEICNRNIHEFEVELV